MKNTSTFSLVPFSEVMADFMKDPEFKARWDAREPERQATYALIEARIKRKLTQRELAKKIGIKQPSLARVEKGKHTPSIAMLSKIAAGLGKKLEIRFVD